eukprot:CAMPEP_0181065214 /NCGR_PEP_ID=MMETSP1070-20121207/24616_1 /TAXON_ID=265543 /ORGANISM="Minutocellus polymorphus, Strain NH13" /LENGTH=53 /DNA_ID=CAMNT_0023145583 /DNA_START=23 /DNA_END=181 /DNA_ORIENTATION=+
MSTSHADMPATAATRHIPSGGSAAAPTPLNFDDGSRIMTTRDGASRTNSAAAA